jgi:30S ribosomal protein S31
MGKGDKKSRRGKIWRGTFGKRRPRARNARPAAAKPAASPAAK